MFHLSCTELSNWLQQKCAVKTVTFAMPTDCKSAKPTLWCHLHSVHPDAHGASAPRLDLNFRLFFVVTPTAKTARAQQELLGKLAIAVREEASTEWLVDPLQPDPWHASPLPPLASINFSIPATWERPLKAAPMVTEAVIHNATFRTIDGKIIGPNKQIMANETIRLPQFKIESHSDHEGKFTFTNVPIPDGRKLRLEVRQQSWELKLNHKPLILRYQATEN